MPRRERTPPVTEPKFNLEMAANGADIEWISKLSASRWRNPRFIEFRPGKIPYYDDIQIAYYDREKGIAGIGWFRARQFRMAA